MSHKIGARPGGAVLIQRQIGSDLYTDVRAGQDSLSKIHDDDFLVFAWPKAS